MLGLAGVLLKGVNTEPELNRCRVYDNSESFAAVEGAGGTLIMCELGGTKGNPVETHSGILHGSRVGMNHQRDYKVS